MKDDQLAAIEARILDCQSHNFGMRVAAADKLAHEDAPALLAMVRERDAALERVKKVRKELLALSNDKKGWTPETRAAYLDASRAIYTALGPSIRAAITATEGA